jgi:hypothetical protein
MPAIVAECIGPVPTYNSKRPVAARDQHPRGGSGAAAPGGGFTAMKMRLGNPRLQHDLDSIREYATASVAST